MNGLKKLERKIIIEQLILIIGGLSLVFYFGTVDCQTIPCAIAHIILLLFCGIFLIFLSIIIMLQEDKLRALSK